MPARPIGLTAFTQVLLLLCLGLAWKAGAQIGQVSYSTKNTGRYVHGPVNVECGWPDKLHSAPFGNWGVDTESDNRIDGNQFQGWCRHWRLCENNDDCDTYCNDPWLQWHSCTTVLPKHKAPNTDFFNATSGREQRTTGGVNTHGTGSIGVSVTCPVDTDGDFYPDSGGCLDAVKSNIPISGHRMTLYELDGWGIFAPLLNDDELVTTLRYPTLYAPVSGILCDVEWCGSGSTGSYKSTTSSTSRIAEARAAVEIVSAQLEDNRVCCDPLNDNTCD